MNNTSILMNGRYTWNWFTAIHYLQLMCSNLLRLDYQLKHSIAPVNQCTVSCLVWSSALSHYLICSKNDNNDYTELYTALIDQINTRDNRLILVTMDVNVQVNFC